MMSCFFIPSKPKFSVAPCRPVCCCFFILFFVSTLYNQPVAAQEPVMFTFFHPAVGNQYIHSIFQEGKTYLPVTGILQMLAIPFEKGEKELSLFGISYYDNQKWVLDPIGETAAFGWENYPVKAEDFLAGETDLYVLPWLFEILFGLHFSINLSSLDIKLKSDYPLPCEEKVTREKLRNILFSRTGKKEELTMMYPRNRKLLGGGMLDYTIAGESSVGYSIRHSYFLSGGMELLGGDLQGSVSGLINPKVNKPAIHGVRWRFVPAENPVLTVIQAGQLGTTGLRPGRITGFSITNDPVIPRQSWDFLTEHGYAEPDSEVELYINHTLAAYTQADEMGHYQFNFPLNYGTSLVEVKIFTPRGVVLHEEKYISVPYNFLPKGIISYVLEGGLSDFHKPGQINQPYPEFHGSFAYGLTKNLTFRTRLEGGPESSSGTFGSIGVSMRLFRQYLINTETVPGEFIRIQSSANWPGNRNASFIYTWSMMKIPGFFQGKALRFDMSVPFQIKKRTSGIRLNADYRFTKPHDIQAGFLTDLNSSIRNYIIRLHLRSRLYNTENMEFLINHSITGTCTRNFPGVTHQNSFFSGVSLRIQTGYDFYRKTLSESGIQWSKPVWPQKGRITGMTGYRKATSLSNGRIFIQVAGSPATSTIYASAGITLVLNSFRTSAQFTSNGRKNAWQHQISGSLAYNESKKQIILSDRNRTGQSGLTVRFFTDDNNNKRYDKGEEIIYAPEAFRPENAPVRSSGKDSVNYFHQMQSYRNYKVEINREGLPNPLLSPPLPQFSLFTDPNRYKRVDIPLYRTGITEGTVTINKNGKISGVPGLRLILTHTETNDTTVLRTFSNGSFYSTDLFPGNYTLEGDPGQLNFLGLCLKPGKISFKIEARVEGDFVDELQFEMFRSPVDQNTAEPEN